MSSSIPPKIILYDFTKATKKGLGARLYEIVLCVAYAQAHDAKVGLIENQPIPYFANRWSDVFEWKHLKDLFQVFPSDSVPQFSTWPQNLPWGAFSKDVVPQHKKKCFSLAFFAKIAQQLWCLTGDVGQEVSELIRQSQFHSGDCLVHIRWSDKVRTPANGMTVRESAEQDLLWYWKEVADYVNSFVEKKDQSSLNATRIFVCTDSDEVLQHIPSISVPILWDLQEDRSGDYCPKAFAEQIGAQIKHQELLTCLKNWSMMKECGLLIGARCSYFFRFGELLHFPRVSKNVKDSDMFGVAEYALGFEKQVRKCKMRSYLHFLNPHMLNLKQINKDEMKTRGMTTINHVLRTDLAQHISQWMHRDDTKAQFYHSIRHQHQPEGKREPISIEQKDQERFHKEYDQAKKDMNAGLFAYSFKQLDSSKHAYNCECPICRVADTLESFEFLDFISEVCGFTFTYKTQTFGSIYDRGDFLTMHQDTIEKPKRVLAFVFSFNPDWKVEQGGILHFVRKNAAGETQFTHSVPPLFNALNIFRVDGAETTHYVSEVTGDASRCSITGWLG